MKGAVVPVRDSDGNLVGKAVPFAAGDPATVLKGDSVSDPIRTADGDLVGRTALYSVSGGVAQPITTLGVDPNTVGDPGGPAGPLDQNGQIPLSQIPIDGLNYQGAWDASTNTPTLSDSTGAVGDMYRVSVAGTQDLGSGPIDFAVGDHIIHEGSVWQRLAPPPAIAWGDITGTLSNQTDLQSALDEKADDSSLATVATSGQYSDLSGRPITRQSGTVALQLDGEELTWPTDTLNGKIRLYNTTPASNNTFYGFGVADGTLVYQVDTDTSVHRFQGVDGSDNALQILHMSAQDGIVASVDLHMSEKQIINLGDPDSARDAANKQYVDGAPSSGITTVEQHDSGDSLTLQPTDAEVQLISTLTTGGSFTVNLPVSPPVGRTFTIKRLTGPSSNNVEISSSTGGWIDGDSNPLVLSAQYGSVTLVFGGTNWFITARYTP